jgi:hypothetical protein
MAGRLFFVCNKGRVKVIKKQDYRKRMEDYSMNKTKTTTLDTRVQKTQLLSALLALLLALTMLPLAALSQQATQAHAEIIDGDAAVWNGTAKSIDWYLNHTEGEDYVISTASQFAGFAAIVNGTIEGEEYPEGYLQDSFVGKTVKLNANINLANFFWQEIGATASAAHGDTSTGAVPATTNATSFQGIFDGQGHTIANVFIPFNQSTPGDNDATNNYKGLFGKVEIGAVVRNVGVTSGTISGSRYVGGIAGMNWGLIENCFNGAAINSNGQRGAGGIAGCNYNNGGSVTIRNCYNYGTITSTFSSSSNSHGFAGGITATNENLVENCYNIGTINSIGANYGGLVGYGGKVHDSYMLEGSSDQPYASASEVKIADETAAAADLIKGSAEMKTTDFVAALGSAFVPDTSGINDGYPILSWQGTTTPPPVEQPDYKPGWDKWRPSFGIWVLDPDGGDPVQIGSWDYEVGQSTYVDGEGVEAAIISDETEDANYPYFYTGIDMYASRLGVVTKGIKATDIIDYYNANYSAGPQLTTESYADFAMKLSYNNDLSADPYSSNSADNPGIDNWLGWDESLSGNTRYAYPDFLIGFNTGYAALKTKALGTGTPIPSILSVTGYNDRVTNLPGALGVIDNAAEFEEAKAELLTKADNERALRSFQGMRPTDPESGIYGANNTEVNLGNDSKYYIGSVWVTLPSDGIPAGQDPDPGSDIDTSWYNTADSSFELSTAAELAGLAAIVNGTAADIEQDSFADKTVTLGSDIALDESDNYISSVGSFGSAGRPMEAAYYAVADDALIWTPIGSGVALNNNSFSEANYFEGTFDGAGYTVSGLYTDSESSVQGLFGNVRQGTIKNLTVDGCVVGTIVVGAVVAHLVDGTVTNVTNNAAVCANGGQAPGSGLENGVSRGGAVGGIVGNAGSTGEASFTISGCVNNGAIVCVNTNQGGRTGGILGLIDQAGYTGTITECLNYGDVNSYQYAGGVVGLNYAEHAPISKSASFGTIMINSSGSSRCGGIVAETHSDVVNCYNRGDYGGKLVSGDKVSHMGGIVSDLMSPAKVINCYNTGRFFRLGTPEQNKTTSTGRIAGSGGGPHSSDRANLINCYFLAIASDEKEFADCDASLGGQGWLPLEASKTSAELKGTAFLSLLKGEGDAFTLDTDNINDGYPLLRFQGGSDPVPVVTGEAQSGDLDGDGFPSASEALQVARFVISGTAGLTAEQIASVDMDNDGVLTMADVVRILRRAAGLS